ncbi:Spore coat protein CotH [Flammeovirgaceae bacterium 311]|nr:Spore coat protein CotH [Flammeovirgaceae bacterium 311]
MRWFFIVFMVISSLPSDIFAQQGNISQWRTAVSDQSVWRYHPGLTNPGAGWMSNIYNDNEWPEGSGGFGFGDDDDVILDQVSSVFIIRKTFNIADKNSILKAVLHMDYDDGFIAYLNGSEIARANMPYGQPGYDQYSMEEHEAMLYRGIVPEAFVLKDALLKSLIKNGENLLAIQVHNLSEASSDISARAWLSFEVSDQSNEFGATPHWFSAPVHFESSNLPIIVITTQMDIPNEPKVEAHMGIIYNGEGKRNNLSDPYHHYDGRIGIELRGQSSQTQFPKKSYSIETQDEEGEDFKVSLLGFPKESDWVLHAPYSDKTLMRNTLTYHLGNKLGNYATRTRYCEVVINGDYKGVYVLMEKIKQDKNRVDIDKLRPQDISGDELTGGYILRVDKIDPNEYPAWNSTPDPVASWAKPFSFQFYEPKGENLEEVQKKYIQNFISEFESALNSNTFTTDKPGYRKFIDLPSFYNFILITELNKDVDAYKFSTYMYKERDSKGGKLHMGPIWDHNLAFGNVNYNVVSQTAPGWTYMDAFRIYWFWRITEDPVFTQGLSCRWQELRQNIMTPEYINNWIDSTAATLEEAQQRNFERWPILGDYIWPNQFLGTSYQEEIDWMKNWIEKRIEWMDEYLTEDCRIPLGLEEDMLANKVQVYPNPSSGAVNFSITEQLNSGRLMIYSFTGKLLFATPLKSNSFSWDGLSNSGIKLSAGTYLYRIEDLKGTYASGKLIVQ